MDDSLPSDLTIKNPDGVFSDGSWIVEYTTMNSDGEIVRHEGVFFRDSLYDLNLQVKPRNGLFKRSKEIFEVVNPGFHDYSAGFPNYKVSISYKGEYGETCWRKFDRSKWDFILRFLLKEE